MTKTEELKAALAAKGLRYVGTRGNLAGRLCIVGEAPGSDDHQEGQPFSGAAGRELDRMLAESGVDTSTCWWTNAYKTRPPDGKADRFNELGLPDLLSKEQLIEELHAHKPTIIVTLGPAPLGILCPGTNNKRTGTAELFKYRGSLLRSDELPWEHYVVPAFQPSYIFRAWDDRQINILCLARVAEEYNHWRKHGTLQPVPQRQLIAEPPADDALDYLRSILSAPPKTVVSIDIENIGIYKGKHATKQRNRIPYVVGFSIDPLFGMSIGLAEYEKEKTAQIWRLMDQILRRKRQVGQNYYTHDLPWLQYIGFGPVIRLADDTLVRHHTLWPELSHKLDFQTFQYTREPYYKDEGKNWTVKERGLMKRYNCKDVCVTLEIFQRQEEEFDARA